MSDQTEIDQVERMAEECHGHRVSLAAQKLREGKSKQAHIAQAEADIFHRVLKAIDQIRAGELNRNPKAEPYVEISRAKRKAELEMAEKDNSEFERGLE